MGKGNYWVWPCATFANHPKREVTVSPESLLQPHQRTLEGAQPRLLILISPFFQLLTPLTYVTLEIIRSPTKLSPKLALSCISILNKVGGSSNIMCHELATGIALNRLTASSVGLAKLKSTTPLVLYLRNSYNKIGEDCQNGLYSSHSSTGLLENRNCKWQSFCWLCAGEITLSGRTIQPLVDWGFMTEPQVVISVQARIYAPAAVGSLEFISLAL